MTDQKNTLIAIVLSALVLIGWQIFFGLPQVEKQKQAQQQQQQTQQLPGAPQSPNTTQPQANAPPVPGTTPQAPGQPGAVPGQTLSREAALAASPRVLVETPSLSGSISLKGGRIDDLSLVKFRETVDPTSPAVVLLAPSGSPHPFYAEYGWSAPPPPPGGTALKLRHLVAAAGVGRARRRPPGNARLQQRRGARIPPQHSR
jgi:YidC/Oxa1 family membrane protein insertase